VMVVLSRIQKELILRLVYNGILEALPFVVVDEDVPHDGVQPPFDIRSFFEIVLVAKGFHEGFLNQVIGILPVAGEADGKSRKKILVRNQKVVEL